jgi:hypothetical protein
VVVAIMVVVLVVVVVVGRGGVGVVVVRFTCSRSRILKFITDVNRLKYFCSIIIITQ